MFQTGEENNTWLVLEGCRAGGAHHRTLSQFSGQGEMQIYHICDEFDHFICPKLSWILNIQCFEYISMYLGLQYLFYSIFYINRATVNICFATSAWFSFLSCSLKNKVKAEITVLTFSKAAFSGLSESHFEWAALHKIFSKHLFFYCEEMKSRWGFSFFFFFKAWNFLNPFWSWVNRSHAQSRFARGFSSTKLTLTHISWWLFFWHVIIDPSLWILSSALYNL